MASKKTFTIGTRKSKLALLQTHLALDALKKAFPDYGFQILSKETAGDLNTTIALRDFTTKNLWTEELEQLMIAGHVDFIVHSLKGTAPVCPHLILEDPAHAHFYRCPHHPPLPLHTGPDDAPRR